MNNEEFSTDQIKIAIVGLGYVGLPLAVSFGRKFQTLGYDLKESRIKDLITGIDETGEMSQVDISNSSKLNFTYAVEDLRACNVFIITVPTPVDSHNIPDLNPLVHATTMVAKFLKDGDTVIYESTVYPGCTEEVLVPILENISRLKYNVNFYCGYSPERINPGDKTHQLESIIKITSGSNEKSAMFVDSLYSSIIKAGTHRTSSIKIAEAAKVIENTQRDVNIALINELSIIFSKLNIDTSEVLKAAGTKWNFLPFKPGLVGGHCIGVDPYYLTYKAQSLGYHPEIILAGRRLNDSMSAYVVSIFIKSLIKKKIHVEESRILIMGLSFKENCSDIRNSKIVDLIKELSEFNVVLDIYDPVVNVQNVKKEYNLDLIANPKKQYYDGIILAVTHSVFLESGIEFIKELRKPNSVFLDLKSAFNITDSDIRL